MSERPMLNQREAATACGVSRTTIRRRREAGDLPGAVQDPVRGWLVPVDDLLAAGFRLNAPAPPENTTAAPAGENGDVDGGQAQGADALRAELERVRHEHALAIAHAEYAKRLAEARVEHLRAQLAERGARIEDLQRAVAALGPPPERPVLQPSVPEQSHASPAPPPVPEESGPAAGERRRRWWGGRP
ncbi:hypothetical protein OG285_38485 [Streptomyces sp. NBC_01471]|uniref:helix-turn-helix transcriptional regulator n=1 Tax=Streptomyces sp. NBC_01471 TaxID=2903879 RepID=UPI003246BF3A